MLGPLLCGRVSPAPLLPKLRGHFAEFLDNASSVGLRILSPSTCVGLRYGRIWSHSGFSRRMVCVLRYSFFAPRRTAGFPHAVFPACPLPCLHRSFRSRPTCSIRVPAVLSICGTGISACCPSATRPRLALGPDFPRADQLYPGTLGYSAGRIPTFLSLLIPAFSLPVPPPSLTKRLRQLRECSPTDASSCIPRLRRRV